MRLLQLHRQIARADGAQQQAVLEDGHDPLAHARVAGAAEAAFALHAHAGHALHHVHAVGKALLVVLDVQAVGVAVRQVREQRLKQLAVHADEARVVLDAELEAAASRELIEELNQRRVAVFHDCPPSLPEK